MNQTSYQPTWPETVVFWGAGATAAFSMRTTVGFGNSFYYLAQHNLSLETRVQNSLGDGYEEWIESFKDLLILLGDPSYESQTEHVAKKHFPSLTESQRSKHIEKLRRTYDWASLYYILQITPGFQTQTFNLQDLFNIIDYNIMNRQGFYVHKIKNGKKELDFIPPEQLVPARNALKILSILFHSLDYQYAIRNKKDIFKQYESFTDMLYDIVLEEGLRFVQEGHSLTKRDFYLFSHAFISMNWDPLLLWFLYNTHKKHNDSPFVATIGTPPVKIKMFHDMGHFMGVRQVDGVTPEVWYPFNETVVQRINDEDHMTGRRVRIGKFYFPHGSSGWRECPNCGKLTMYLGGSWDPQSESLFPPSLLPAFSFQFQTKSIEEERAFTEGRIDSIQCSFCGTLTEAQHVPIIMQSSFKGNHPSFTEEIQRDMRVAIEKALHIVLFGYTLPPDDVIYRSLLAARQNRATEDPIYCSVIVGKHEHAPDRWLEGKDLEDFCQSIYRKYPDDSFVKAVQSAKDVFGSDQVRGYAKGIPQVFLEPNAQLASKSRVLNILYPSHIKRFANHKVQRNV